MKLVLAAPASSLPSFPTALLSHVTGACAAAQEMENAVSKIASINRVIVLSSLAGVARACAGGMMRSQAEKIQ
jgi:hypothetical protein